MLTTVKIQSHSWMRRIECTYISEPVENFPWLNSVNRHGPSRVHVVNTSTYHLIRLMRTRLFFASWRGSIPLALRIGSSRRRHGFRFIHFHTACVAALIKSPRTSNDIFSKRFVSTLSAAGWTDARCDWFNVPSTDCSYVINDYDYRY